MFGELASGLVCVCVFVPHVASDAAARQTVMGVHKCACHSCAPHLTDGGLVRPLRTPPPCPNPPQRCANSRASRANAPAARAEKRCRQQNTHSMRTWRKTN